MTDTKNQTHINHLKAERSRTQKVIGSGKIYQVVLSQKSPISDVFIAAELEVSVSEIRGAIAKLIREGLILKDYQRNYRPNYRKQILYCLGTNPTKSATAIVVASKTNISISLVKLELSHLVEEGLVIVNNKSSQANLNSEGLTYSIVAVD